MTELTLNEQMSNLVSKPIFSYSEWFKMRQQVLSL